MSSSSSSSPRETYEEDREYESQAKRLKTEEGEIDYSAEESENRREAAPRGGGDGGGGGGRSFSQPVTKRGVQSAVLGGSPRKQGPAAAPRPGTTRLCSFPIFSAADPGRGALALPCGVSALGFTCFPHPDRKSGSGPGGPRPGCRPRRDSARRALNLGRVARRARRGGVASAPGGFGRDSLFVKWNSSALGPASRPPAARSIHALVTVAGWLRR